MEPNFLTLYEFPEVCPSCYKTYQPYPKYEIIPCEGGVIEYHYLYDQTPINAKQRNYLQKHLKYFFQWISENSQMKSTYLFIDAFFLRHYHQEILFLSQTQSLILMSLIRCNLEVFMIFS